MIPIFPILQIPPEGETLREPVRRFLNKRLADLSSLVRARSWLGFMRTYRAMRSLAVTMSRDRQVIAFQNQWISIWED